MKIGREARNTARKLFSSCRKEDGTLDETMLVRIVSLLAEEKPRHYMQILSRLYKLAKLDAAKNSAVVETAAALGGARGEVESELKKRFGSRLSIEFKTNPELIAGARVRVGSDVWDGSVQARLNALRSDFKN
jgi:F-type H+-transporting ATPase subunit delta